VLRKLYMDRAPILKTVCKPVTEFDAGLKNLVKDMADTMVAFNGVGLAAPQIGETKRVVVVRQQTGDAFKRGILVFVNPVISWQSEDIVTGTEGCLSYPGVWKEIPRPNNIIVNGFDINGKPIRHGYYGFEARIFCHEIDHLNGECKVGKVG
jgi:peptide deformylase